MKNRSLAILSIAVVSLFALVYFMVKPASTYLSGYLSKSEYVQADILVVEGWLPQSALQMVYNEYKENKYKYVVVTGIRYSSPYYKISDNGYLIFYTSGLLSGLNEPRSHSIAIKAFSDMGGENRAHFNLFINDSMTGDFFVEKRKKSYTLNWYGRLTDIDSVIVQYDNDIYEPPLDRNLSVREICFDHKISVPYLFHSEYDMLKLDGKLRSRNNITTTAQLTRMRLMSMGIDSAIIKEASSDKPGINRTLTSALAFRDWLFSGDKELSGINIISLGPHARRTWMTYNKILNEKYRIGIISIPEDGNKQLWDKRKAFKTLREILGIIYYWFILIPY